MQESGSTSCNLIPVESLYTLPICTVHVPCDPALTMNSLLHKACRFDEYNLLICQTPGIMVPDYDCYFLWYYDYYYS